MTHEEVDRVAGALEVIGRLLEQLVVLKERELGVHVWYEGGDPYVKVRDAED